MVAVLVISSSSQNCSVAQGVLGYPCSSAPDLLLPFSDPHHLHVGGSLKKDSHFSQGLYRTPTQSLLWHFPDVSPKLYVERYAWIVQNMNRRKNYKFLLGGLGSQAHRLC